MKIVIALAVLCLVGCTTQTPAPGRGNEPTYSGNSSGNYIEQVRYECAIATVEEFRKDPSIDADALFLACQHEVGVRSI